MIRTLYRTAKGNLIVDLSQEALAKALEDPEGTLWVDVAHVPAQREAILTFLNAHFDFHPLALDDALQESHVSRVDDWGDYVYLVAHALDLELNRTLETHEVDIFLGPNYLVTLHEVPIPALDQVWAQAQRGADRTWSGKADRLLYTLLDQIVAAYLPVVDNLDEEIEDLEDEIFGNPARGTITRITRLRRTLVRLRRTLGALRETANRLARDPYKVIDPGQRVYFRDVYDHLVRLYDIVEGLRDLALGALDSYLSVTSNRLNETMRTLTVVTLLFMPVTFLTGFLGMNFFGEGFNVPNPLPAGVTFLLAMLLMAATPPAMLWYIRRRGWLRSPFPEDGDRAESGEPPA
jgi:magnesium transporter